MNDIWHPMSRDIPVEELVPKHDLVPRCAIWHARRNPRVMIRTKDRDPLFFGMCPGPPADQFVDSPSPQGSRHRGDNTNLQSRSLERLGQIKLEDASQWIVFSNKAQRRNQKNMDHRALLSFPGLLLVSRLRYASNRWMRSSRGSNSISQLCLCSKAARALSPMARD